MISVNNLTIQYGKKHLFNDVSARVGDQDRIGLVGVNGAGKSTLLKIIAGQIETDFGVVQRAKYATIGYLPQEVSGIDPDKSLIEEARGAFADLLRQQEELDQINQQLATITETSSDFTQLLQQQGELQHLLDQADIFQIDAKIEKVLLGLGFKECDFLRECRTFSGGWLMRLMLARLLLRRPAFLLLDEPTNHLDIESLTWLESFLREYPGALVIISHDRTFLDNLTTATWEISLGNLSTYKGNYSYFVKEKELRMEVQRAAYDNQQAQIQQTMRFVQRFRAKSTKAKQVQSRLKLLSKMDRIEIDDTDKQINFRFPPAAPSGRTTLTVEHVAKSFAEKQVLADVSFELERGDKLAVVGVNGVGKSTLVKLLAGLHQPDAGSIRFGHNVTFSYFGQHQAQELSPSLTVLETLAMVDGDRTVTQDRTLLAAFLFQGEDVDKKVMVLSGGEKSRLALAKMITIPANLLIMDEPTNHLDMASQEILQEAMRQYDGTVIVVSHNRYFLDSFVNKVLFVKDGKATIYHGNLTYFLSKIKQEEADQANPAKPASPQPGETRQTPPQTPGQAAPSPDGAAKTRGNKETRQAQARIRQEKTKRVAPHRQAVEQAEQQIEQLERRKGELEALMADPETYKNSDQFSSLGKEYGEIGQKLGRIYFKWEKAQEEIERIDREFDRQMAALEG